MSGKLLQCIFVKRSLGLRTITTTYAASCWKNFSLEDELTLEIRKSIEKKWHSRVYGVNCPAEKDKQLNKPNPSSLRYILPMFPYPSGRLHLGHVRVYTLSDVLARYHRLQGHTVIHPMGWDAFGLPAENAARDHGVDPEKWTLENIANMRNQIMDMGCCFDWDREFKTCDPSYYKWTQWLFKKLWEKGLAYKKRAFVFWDPVDQTVLAEEQVNSDGRSWRSGAKVEKKLLRQWFIRTPVFAQQLSEGLTAGNLKHGWRDIISLQNHWIGEIKGYFTDCNVDLSKCLGDEEMFKEEPLRIWFSESDSLKNAKYFILRPDHFLLQESKAVANTFPNGIQRMNFDIKNPATGIALPVFSGPIDKLPWIPSSVDCRTDELLSDEEKFPESVEKEHLTQQEIFSVAQNSLKSTVVGTDQPFEFYPASLKLRDWLVSRQRKWGTLIPAMTCLDCGMSSVIHHQELPVTPNSTTTEKKPCSHCHSTNTCQESDTLDTFFDSSWYFFRFLDPHNKDEIFSKYKTTPLPVHTYIGGKEHATLHLYYARFMTQFLNSIELSPVTEPFQKLIPIGMVLGEAHIVKGSGKYLHKDDCITDGKKVTNAETGESVYTKWEKMSKSKHNGIDPTSVLEEFGLDSTRLLTMAEASPTSPRKWPPNNTDAFVNWQKKFWILIRQFVDAKDFGDIVFIDDEVWQKSEANIFDTRNYYLKGINHDYSVTSQISVVISKLQALTGSLKKVPKNYLKDSIEFERALGATIIGLYPIMPAFSAQLWQSFRAVASFTEPEFDLDSEVWEQQWPSVDWRYELDLICKIKGKEFVAKVERNYLDTMDQQTALQIVLDLPDVQKRLSSGQCQVLSFNLEPGFRAVISIKEQLNFPQSPTPDNTDQNMTKQI